MKTSEIPKNRDGETENPWIRIASGGRFHFLDYSGAEYNMEDAAAALSRICRFGGHLSDAIAHDEIYSVAQHSVYVYRLLKKKKAPAYTYPWAITHDVPEAYYMDMVSPLKSLLPEYREMQDKSAEGFREEFGIPFDGDIEAYVKWADYQVYFAERRALTVIPKGEEDLAPAPEFTIWEIDPQFFLWRPAYARYQFLLAYAEAMALCKGEMNANTP